MQARNRDTDEETARPGSQPPKCPMCRSFEGLLDVHRITVLGVERLHPRGKTEDWMARDDKHVLAANALLRLLRTHSVTEYIKNLSSMIGKELKPAVLRPGWARRDDWPLVPRVPRSPRRPTDDWTYWTLTFSTEWLANRPEADFMVQAAIGGHSLGGQYGPVTIDVAPILRVRVRAHLKAGRRKAISVQKGKS